MNNSSVEQNESRRKAQQLPDGSTALISDSPGFSLEVVGGGEAVEVVNPTTWDDLHNQVQTGKLKFATVKKRLKQDI